MSATAEIEAINAQTKRNILILRTPLRNKHQSLYRLKYGGIKLLHSQLGGRGSIKIRAYANKVEAGAVSMQSFKHNFFLIYKLLVMITRLFANFIKIPI